MKIVNVEELEAELRMNTIIDDESRWEIEDIIEDLQYDSDTLVNNEVHEGKNY